MLLPPRENGYAHHVVQVASLREWCYTNDRVSGFLPLRIVGLCHSVPTRKPASLTCSLVFLLVTLVFRSPKHVSRSKASIEVRTYYQCLFWCPCEQHYHVRCAMANVLQFDVCVSCRCIEASIPVPVFNQETPCSVLACDHFLCHLLLGRSHRTIAGTLSRTCHCPCFTLVLSHCLRRRSLVRVIFQYKYTPRCFFFVQEFQTLLPLSSSPRTCLTSLAPLCASVSLVLVTGPVALNVSHVSPLRSIPAHVCDCFFRACSQASHGACEASNVHLNAAKTFSSSQNALLRDKHDNRQQLLLDTHIPLD